MTIFAEIARPAALAALMVSLAAVAPLPAQSQEAAARLRLESGREFLRRQDYGEALKDFQMVLQTFPATSVADDALLEIGRYQLETARDPQAADQTADTLLKQYPESDSAPMALVVKGRAALAMGRAPEQINAAVASFDRVPILYQGTDAVPQALYYAGEAARVGGRRDEAIERFGRLATQYPSSVWAARALLGSAASLVDAGQPIRAMEQLQQIRQQFPAEPEAATALEWNTILYRLYVRAPAQPAYHFTPAGQPATKYRDVRDMAMDRANTLHIATKTGIESLTPEGAAGAPVPSREPRSIFFSGQNRLVTLHDEGALRDGDRPALVLAVADDDGRMKPLRLEAGVTTSFGELIVADREMRALLRFSPEGKLIGEFARQILARRLAITEMDDVAALDTDAKTVTVFGRDGKITARIPERGTGYQLRQPMDVGFDRLGHLYVLDRRALLVFAPQGARLITTFSIPERTPGHFNNAEAMALDSAARLFVFDGRSSQVQVYR
jgi:TolA-binding protein